jgi:aspartate racemase
VPGLHIAAEVVDAAASEGRRRVGILGTRFIMEGWMYPRALAGQGIESRVPGDEDRAIVDRIIFDELVNGVISDASRREYVRVIESFRRDGCDAVALVCTEIPLLVASDSSPLPVLDSTRLIARAHSRLPPDSGRYRSGAAARRRPDWRAARARVVSTRPRWRRCSCLATAGDALPGSQLTEIVDEFLLRPAFVVS